MADRGCATAGGQGGAVAEAVVEVDDDGVDGAGGEGEEELEEGEEGRVVEGPGAGLVGVPTGDGEGVGQGEPVAVDLEVGAPVGGDQEELDAGGNGRVPQELGGRRRRHGGGEVGDRRRGSRLKKERRRRRSCASCGTRENDQKKDFDFY